MFYFKNGPAIEPISFLVGLKTNRGTVVAPSFNQIGFFF